MSPFNACTPVLNRVYEEFTKLGERPSQYNFLRATKRRLWKNKLKNTLV